MPGILVSIDAYNRSTNSRMTVRAGAARNTATLGADGFVWEPALSVLPRFGMQLMDADLGGQLMVGVATVTIATHNIKRLPAVNQLQFEGAPVRIYSGDGSRLSLFNQQFVGRVISGTPDADTGMVQLALQVDRALVDVPLLPQTYGGGGGADGDVELRGRAKPAVFGRPVNVPPVLIDAVNAVYQYDAYGNAIGMAGVYENLASFGEPVANYGSYATLVAATIPEGRYATCTAQGMFRLGADAGGAITCDPIANAATPGSLAMRWLQNHAGIPASRLRLSDFSSLDTDLAALIGRVPPVSHYAAESSSVLELWQRLAASCNAVPLLMLDGSIGMARIPGGNVVMTLEQGGQPTVTAWKNVDAPPPWWRGRLAAERSYYVNSPPEIDYEDDLRDLGDYRPGETYRLGNVVRWVDGARYIYRNATASTVSPPDGVYWAIYEDAPDATQIRYPSGATLADKEPETGGATRNRVRGEWGAGVAYLKGDSVIRDGRGYSALVDHTGSPPPSAAWMLTSINGMTPEEAARLAAARAEIDAIGSDAVLSKGEKDATVREYQALMSDAAALYQRFLSLGSPGDIFDPINDMIAARNALSSMLSNITPPYNDVSSDSAIDSLLWKQRWNAAYDRLAVARAAITGRKGDKGDPGKDGVNGVPGVRGADGTTWYPYYAYANSPDGAVDFTTGAPGTRAYVGFATGTSPTEPTSPSLYAWSQYRGPAFGMTGDGVAIAGTQIIKTLVSSGWDAQAYSTVGFRNGATATARAGQTGMAFMYGLNKDPATNASFATLDYAFYFTATEVACYESNLYITSFGAYTTSTTTNVDYDGKYVRYYVDGVMRREVAAPPDMTLYFDSSFSSPGARAVDVAFASFGKAGDKGADGAPGMVAYLTNQQHTVPADAAGTVTSYSGTATSIVVMAGGQNVTTSFALESLENPQGLTVPGTYPNYSVTGGLDAGEPSATLTFNLIGSGAYAGIRLKVVYSLGKLKAGANGTAPPLISIQASSSTIVTNADGSLVTNSNFLFSATRQNTSAGIEWRVFDGSGASHRYYAGDTYLTDAADLLAIINHPGNNGKPNTRFCTVHATCAGVTDVVSVYAVKNGAAGVSPPSFELSTYAITLNASYAGEVKPGQLPRHVYGTVTQGGQNVTAASTFTVTSSSNVAASVSGNDISINSATSDGSIDIVAIVGGVALPAKRVSITRISDPAPPQSATGQSTNNGTGTLASTTYQTEPTQGVILLQTPASGVLPIVLFATYLVVQGDKANRSCVYSMKVVYRLPGGAWADLIAERVGSPSVYLAGSQDHEPGDINYSANVTLDANKTYEFAYMYRRYSGVSNASYFSGSMRIGT